MAAKYALGGIYSFQAIWGINTPIQGRFQGYFKGVVAVYFLLGKGEVPVCKSYAKDIGTSQHSHLCLYCLWLLCKTGSLKWSKLKVSVFKWSFWWLIAQLVNSCISSPEKVPNCTFRIEIESCLKTGFYAGSHVL